MFIRGCSFNKATAGKVGRAEDKNGCKVLLSNTRIFVDVRMSTAILSFDSNYNCHTIQAVELPTQYILEHGSHIC